MGKNQSASNLTNIIQYNNGNITFVSGSTTLMQISSSGAITTTGVISGSNALSASYAATASFVALAQTASFVQTAQTASFVANAQSASNAVSAITASSADSFLVRNTLTAQTIVVQTITSSVDFVTGSTQFGSKNTDIHTYTGSVAISGSSTFGLNVNAGTLYVGASGNVGVGTTSPNMKLDVSGSGLGGGIRSMGASGASGGKGVEIGYELGDFGTVLAYDRTGGVFKQLRINDLIHAGIGSTGNVGIGTTNPTSKLEIFNGASSSEVRNWMSSSSGYSNYILDTDNNINYRAQLVSFGTTAAGTLLGINRASGSFLAKSGGPLAIGTRDTQPLVFGTNEVERMRITGSNVGIGTSSPSDFIDAGLGLAIIATSGRTGLSLGSTQGTANEVLGRLSFTNTNSTNIGNKRLAYVSGVRGTTNNSAYLEFGTADDALGTQRMVITQGGNVGIGVATIDGRLTVTSATAGPYGTGTPDIAVGGNIGSSTTALQIYRTAATGGNIGIDAFRSGVSGASLLLNAANGGNVGIGTTNPLCLLQAGGIGNSIVRLGTSSTTNTSTSSAFAAWNSSGQDLLTVRGDGLVAFAKINDFTTGNSPNTWINPSPSYGIYINTSSIRYKRDIVDYDKGLSTVSQLRPVYYKGKSEVDGDKQFAGFIAEEIDELGLTEFVNYLEDGRPNSLSYPNMVVLLTKAIQELNTKLDAANAEIEALKSK